LKYILVSGGVLSGLGKGITAATSLSFLSPAALKVTLMSVICTKY